MPEAIVRQAANQLNISDIRCLEIYRRSESRLDHTAEIKRHYGYRDFTHEPEHFRFIRWLYTRSWLSSERPSVLFDVATSRLVARKVLLPGVTITSSKSRSSHGSSPSLRSA